MSRLRASGLAYRVDRWLERLAGRTVPSLLEVQARALILDLLAAVQGDEPGSERLCRCRCVYARHDPVQGCRGLRAGVPCPCRRFDPVDAPVDGVVETRRRLPCGCEATMRDGRIVHLVDLTRGAPI